MRKYGLLLLLVVLLLPAVWSLFHTGFFVSDDGEWMVIRLTAFHQALTSGQFPVRFAYRLNYGYGYPIFNFAYPGSFYLGEIFYLLGFSAVDSVKMVFIISMMLAGLFSFFWLKSKFSSLASLLGSILYVYSPYLLWDVYRRGSLGEVFVLALVPIYLWLIERKNWLFAGLAFGCLIISHNVLALILLPFIILYPLVVGDRNQEMFRLLFKIGLIGLAFSAFFWLPAIWESSLTVLSQTVVGRPSEHLVSNLSLLGYANLVIFFVSLGLFLKKANWLVGFFLLMFLIALFFSIPASAFFWNVFPWSFLIQFPFRFLSLLLPVVAFLAAFAFDKVIKKQKFFWLCLILPAVFYFSWPFAKPSEFINKDQNFYLTNEHSTAIHNEYTPFWVKAAPAKHFESKIEVIQGRASIKNVVDRGQKLEFISQAEEPAIIRVNTLYFPGWKVLIDGKKSPFSFTNDRGVIEFHLESGQHRIMVKFGETPLRLLADLISLAGLLIVLILLLKNKLPRSKLVR